MQEDMVSYWHRTEAPSHWPRLEADAEADVLIVGGGITGITCAWCLAQRGAQPLLVEAAGLCGGTTGNSTGKVTVQHGLIYQKIAASHGMEAARLFARSQQEALDFVRRRVAEGPVDCQCAQTDAVVFASREADRQALRTEYETVSRLGIGAEYAETADFPPGSYGTLRCGGQLVLHPVRYGQALAAAAAAKGARICADTKAVAVEDGERVTVRLENGRAVRARWLVMATQYPLFDGPHLFFTRLYPRRAYGVAVETQADWPDGSFISSSEPTRSIRTHVERGRRILIVVGDDHTTARGEAHMERHLENLEDYARRMGGEGEVLARWSAQDYDTPDGIPYIGPLSGHPHIFAAAGFQKWGLSSGTLAGMLIAAQTAGESGPYDALYSMGRADLSGGIGRVTAGNLSAVGELVRSKFESTQGIEGLEPGEGRAIRFGGRRAGIYRTPDGRVTVLDISCTHMTTELRFNEAEKTWDCPAHGGRFAAEDGRLLEGPPKNPLPVLYRGEFSDLVTKKGK